MDSLHPFDAIDFNDDGRGSPDIEPEDIDRPRASWRATNLVDVPMMLR